MASPRGKGGWALALMAASAGVVLPSSASATNTCAFDAGSGALTVTHTIDNFPATILAGASGTGQTMVGISPVSASCPLHTGLEVASIDYVQAGGVSDLIVIEPSALRRGTGALDPAAEIPVDITDSEAVDGTLVHIVLEDQDTLPEHWVFSSNGATPAAPMAVNTNASEAAPDFDIVMSPPTFATFVALGSPGADVIDGSGGGQGPAHLRALTIFGRGGADVLKGGGGNDAIDGGPADDAIDGGPGLDIADYVDSVLPVSIDLAATGPQDGGSMGRDTLASIEYLGGGQSGDLLRGTAANETLDGSLGDDVLEGRGADDALVGDLGSDTASYASAPGPVTLDLALTTPQATGGAGTDTLDQVENVVGGPDTDVLRGSEGPNTIEGGRGGDAMLAQGGDDVVLARDGGPDTVNCGPGADRALVDPGGIDAVTGCETVVAGVAAGLPGGAAPGTPSAVRRKVRATLGGAPRQRLSRAGVAVRLRCAALACSARATGTVSARIGGRLRRLSLISRRVRLAAGRSALVRLGLTPRNRALVAAALTARRPAVVRVRVAVTDASAATATLRRTIRLVR